MAKIEDMPLLDRIPLTDPERTLGRFSQHEGQAEYVACMEAGLSFAASGHEGQWLYFDGDHIAVLYPNGDKVYAPYRGLNWITEAQKL